MIATHKFGALGAFVSFALLLAAGAPTADARGLEQKPAGDVRLLVRHTDQFDQYTRSPSDATKTWMREHYDRMEVHDGYFDSRLSWFPNGWLYKDLYGVKPDWSVYQQHPEWILRDANDNQLYIPWECSGSRCSQFAADFGNRDFRNWWISTARAALNKGYPGLTIDDVNFTWRVSNGSGKFVAPIDPRTGRAMTLADWRRYMAEFLEQIRAAFPNTEILHNMVWYSAPLNDASLLRAVAAADTIHLERGGSDNGLVGGGSTNSTYGFQTFMGFVDWVHAQGRTVAIRDSGTSTQLREFGLATWLLLSQGRDVYGVDVIPWVVQGSYWTGFDTNLGEPTEKWSRQSNGLLRRKFACGVVYLNQPNQSTTTQSLGATMTRLDGSLVSSITLPTRSAAILKSDSCSGSGSVAPPPVTPPVEPTTTIRQDILGRTVTAPLSISGTASAAAGVAFVWSAVHDLDRNLWWTGSAWQSGYTRFKVQPASPGASQTTWSYTFNPGRSGAYQAFGRATDVQGGYDRSDEQVWFRL